LNLGLDLKVLSDVDYGVAVSDGVLFSIPDEAKAYYPGLGFDFGAPRLTYLDGPHSRGVSDRKPDPERFCRTGLHGPQGADPNSRIVAAGCAERVACTPNALSHARQFYSREATATREFAKRRGEDWG
jgi:hypothetical protein